MAAYSIFFHVSRIFHQYFIKVLSIFLFIVIKIVYTISFDVVLSHEMLSNSSLYIITQSVHKKSNRHTSILSCN